MQIFPNDCKNDHKRWAQERKSPGITSNRASSNGVSPAKLVFERETRTSFEGKYPKRRKSKVRGIQGQSPSVLSAYIRNFRQSWRAWVTSIYLRRVNDVIYENDVRGKCLMRHVYICEYLHILFRSQIYFLVRFCVLSQADSWEGS